MSKYFDLVLPMILELRRPIQPDFAYIGAARKYAIE
jgi:hypothetical protein